MTTDETSFRSFLGFTKFVHRFSTTNSFNEAVPVFSHLADALELLTKTRPPGKHSSANVLEAAMSKGVAGLLDSSTISNTLYRGQTNMQFDLIPTALRTPGANSGLLRWDSDTLVQTLLKYGLDLKVALKELEQASRDSIPLSFVNQLTSKQRLALLRHFGMKSSFMDWTSDLQIAAHFASAEPHRGIGQQIGVIYAIDLDEFFSNMSGIRASSWPHLGEITRRIYATSFSFEKMSYISSHEAEPISGSLQLEDPNATEIASFELTAVAMSKLSRLSVQSGVFLRIGSLEEAATLGPVDLDIVSTVFRGHLLLKLATRKVGFIQTEENSKIYLRSQLEIYPPEEYSDDIARILRAFN